MSRVSARAGALLLMAAGGGLSLLAASSRWASLSAEDGLVGASAAVTGAQLAPLCVAAGVVGLAAVPAALAVRGWLRRVVAAVVTALGLVAVAQVVRVGADVDGAARAWWAVEVGALAQTAAVAPTAWPVVAAVGLALVVAGGGLVLARGSRWGGLSSRYEAPGTSASRRASGSEADTWQALDRGEDPTDADGPPP